MSYVDKKTGKKYKKKGGRQKLPDGEASFNALYSRYIHKAKQRKIPFNLTKEEFKSLTESNCFYCNKEPEQIAKKPGSTNYIYNGIDRINNNIAYSHFNCVSCCWFCNRSKAKMDVNSYTKQIEKTYNFLFQPKGLLN